MYKHESNDPIAKRTLESFVQNTYVAGERVKHAFEREIVWLQSSETTLTFVHGGKVLKTGADTNDYYGYLTSFRQDAHDPQATADEFQVTQDSSLEIQLVVRLFITPVFESAEDKESNKAFAERKRRTFTRIPEEWRKETIVDGHPLFPALEAQDIDQAVVWSSKLTPAECEAQAQAFRDKWPNPETPVTV
jgi:hypothetical protein